MTLRVEAAQPAGVLVKEDDYHIRIGANPTDKQLQQALSLHQNVTVLKLEFDQQAVHRTNKFFAEPFTLRETQRGFDERMRHMPGFWCCREPDGPHGKGGTPYPAMLEGKGVEYRQL